MALHAEQSNREAFKRLCDAMAATPKPIALVGAGTSVRAGYPTWSALLDRMHKLVLENHALPPRTERNLRNQSDLLWRAQEYRQRLGEDEYFAFIRETFPDLEEGRALDPMLPALVSLPFGHVLTTNYDDVLEHAHEQAGLSAMRSIEWTEEDKLRDFLMNLGSSTRRYVHLHGRASEPRSVVLTDQDYVNRYARSVDAHRKLFAVFATQRLVFVGFSLTDPELAALLREVHISITAGSARHFALLALKEDEDDTLERRRLKQKYGIDAIFYPFTPDHSQLDRLVNALKRGSGDYEDLWDEPVAPAPVGGVTARPATLPPPAAQPPQRRPDETSPPGPPPLFVLKRQRRPDETWPPSPPSAAPLQKQKTPATIPPVVPPPNPPAPGAGGIPSAWPPVGPFVESAPAQPEQLASVHFDDDRRDYQTGAGFVSGEEEAAPTPELSTATPKHRLDPEDPQRGQWGGRAERNNRRLSAVITPLDDGWFKIHLEVRSTDPKRSPLKGLVRFNLHDTFRQPVVAVMADKGVAVYEVDAFGPFTVGAEVDGGKTQLELDLATVPDAPSAFREF